VSSDPDRSSIDLNADVGERVEARDDDAKILSTVTSASVACGFHAGDPALMADICGQAVAEGVRIGAHISYFDRRHFGRRELDLSTARLTGETTYQLGALAAVAEWVGGRVSYVKPHGALYWRCSRDPEQAGAVVDAILSVDPGLALLVPPGSTLGEIAGERGVVTVEEGFADRRYLPDGGLAPRRDHDSVLGESEAIAQGLRIATEGLVTATDGTRLPLPVRSLCVHSDTPGAVTLVTALRAALDRAVEVRAFA
jgi:5-oxoprolinase (ATP-hydrolysing) subunit A